MRFRIVKTEQKEFDLPLESEQTEQAEEEPDVWEFDPEEETERAVEIASREALAKIQAIVEGMDAPTIPAPRMLPRS